MTNHTRFVLRTLAAISALLPLFAQAPDGAALYKDRCALCHDRSSETRAPAPTALREMSPENVVRALESGLMQEQGKALSAAEKRAVAEFLTGKTVGQAVPEAKSNSCPGGTVHVLRSGDWNGWGA